MNKVLGKIKIMKTNIYQKYYEKYYRNKNHPRTDKTYWVVKKIDAHQEQLIIKIYRYLLDQKTGPGTPRRNLWVN